MNKEFNLDTFKYFLECYFNVSANYNELDKNIKDFITSEKVEYHQKLSAELIQILQIDNWEIIQEWVKKYGLRKMNEEKLKWLIQRLLDNLQM